MLNHFVFCSARNVKMAFYDFKALSPVEFEDLSNELLSRHFKINIERFKEGRDRGIDGRFIDESGEKWIIQAKHYSSFSDLKSKLSGSEKQKIEKIKPTRYILSTSLPLSPDNKQSIINILSPFARKGDVLGREQLNALLAEYPDVERNCFKLWIPSTEALIAHIHPEILEYGSEIINHAKHQRSQYKKTKAYHDAKNRLRRDRVIVIAGEAGIGKTTMAEQLCLDFVIDGYTLVAIEKDISEARKIRTSGKHIYYFDDFLGANFYDAHTNNNDASIMRFSEKIKNSIDDYFSRR